MADNLRHAQYRDDGTQIDDPQKIVDDGSGGEGGISSDANNALVLGSDDKPYLDEDNLIAADEVADLAVLLALTGVPDGRRYTVLAPLCTGGAGGIEFVRDSTAPVGWWIAGGQMLWSPTATLFGVSGGTTTEQIFGPGAFAAGVLRACRRIRIRDQWTAAGTDPNPRSLRIRIGATGTTADPILLDGSGVWAAANGRFAHPVTVQPITATTLRISAGTNAIGLSPDSQGGGTAVIGDRTVDSLAAAVYVSLTVQQGNSPGATVSLTEASIFAE